MHDGIVFFGLSAFKGIKLFSRVTLYSVCSTNVFRDLIGASRDRTAGTSMQSAANTEGNRTLVTQTKQFDLNSALYNLVTSNFKT